MARAAIPAVWFQNPAELIHWGVPLGRIIFSTPKRNLKGLYKRQRPQTHPYLTGASIEYRRQEAKNGGRTTDK